MSAEQITVEDGKYTVIFDNGQLHALRYGERWRDLSGDKLIYALMCRIQALEAAASTCLSHPAGSDQQPGLSLAGEQPAEVSDEPEQASKVVNDSCWKFVEAMPHKIPGPIWNDLKPAIYAALIHYHRAILALRPQAVPMTEAWQEVAACPDGDVWFSLSCGHVVMGWKQGHLLLDWEAAIDHDCCSDASAIKAMPVTPPTHHGITAPAGGEKQA